MIRLTVPVSLRIGRSVVNGRPIRIAFNTGQKVICSCVNGAIAAYSVVRCTIGRDPKRRGLSKSLQPVMADITPGPVLNLLVKILTLSRFCYFRTMKV